MSINSLPLAPSILIEIGRCSILSVVREWNGSCATKSSACFQLHNGRIRQTHTVPQSEVFRELVTSPWR